MEDLGTRLDQGGFISSEVRTERCSINTFSENQGAVMTKKKSLPHLLRSFFSFNMICVHSVREKTFVLSVLACLLDVTLCESCRLCLVAVYSLPEYLQGFFY